MTTSAVHRPAVAGPSAPGRLGAPAEPPRSPPLRRARTQVRALLELSRPAQWIKNLLVLAAPAAAGVLDLTPVIARTLLLLVAFTAASVAIYAVNDVQDVTLDRQHPRKRLRPVASGVVSVRAALSLALAAAAVALALGALLGPEALLCVAAYLVISVLYCVRLKHVAVLDVVAVASGFVLRSLSGAAANHLPISNWFLLISLFGALYLVSGKRSAEIAGAGAGAPDGPAAVVPSELTTRPVLAAYPSDWLQQLVTLSLAGTVLSYAMWSFQYLGTDVFHPVLAASFVPFLIAMLRYGLMLAQGKGERPEQLLVRDRMLLVAGGSWALMTAASLYLA